MSTPKEYLTDFFRSATLEEAEAYLAAWIDAHTGWLVESVKYIATSNLSGQPDGYTTTVNATRGGRPLYQEA